VLGVETPGLAAQFFFRDTATGSVSQASPAEASLDYTPAGECHCRQTRRPVPRSRASGRVSLEAPEAGFFNIVVETDAGASVQSESQ